MSRNLPTAGRFLMRDAIGSRTEQEDAAICLVSPETEAALLVVCDGVGGSRDGGGAARGAVEDAEKYWREKGRIFEKPEEELGSLARFLHENLQVRHGEGMSAARTTLVALYRTATRAVWMHSGDSRLYHFRKGRLLTRTRDHSVVEILVQQGDVAESEMGSHPDQGRLLQSLGGKDYEEPTFDSAEITPEDGFLLCTDGFWERTTPGEMAKILYAKRPAEALDRAIERAVRRNGPKGDNVTAAIALPDRHMNPLTLAWRRGRDTSRENNLPGDRAIQS